MSEGLRAFLYPLGYLAALFFGSRFLLQWIASEVKKKSVVPISFWWLSLAGNVTLLLHSWIQLQFHVCLIQGGNAVISWRNINLNQPERARFSTRSTIFMLISVACTIVLLFSLQPHSNWFRIPHTAFSTPLEPLHFSWHLFGFLGMLLFALRFWVQWWHAERSQKSVLDKSFWWLSLVGDLMMLLYFFAIGDPVNLIGPLFGLIPYVRNLMLLKA